VVEAHVEREERVTPLELFFDLVFVFAITQVTSFLAADPSWLHLVEGMLVLAALWWAWTAYAWLTTTINPDEGAIRLAMLAAMAAMLIVSLAVPGAFGADGTLFAAAYLAVRLAHLVLYVLASRGDRDLLRAVVGFAPTAAGGSLLILLGSFLPERPQLVAWAGALVVDYLGPLIGRGRGWRVAPRHFAERHALIIIIALGESIVAIGVGAGVVLGIGTVVAAVLGIAVISTLWWLYFDVVAIVAERRLAEAQGAERGRIARDSYSYLHFPIVAGIVLFALGLKKTLTDVGHELETVAALGLCGGVALYLLAHVAFRLRNVHTLNKQRLATAAVLLAFLPFADEVPALAALAVVAAMSCVLVAYEAVRFREARTRIRGPQTAS
jgi:low temperature requirement protein LtrA